MLACERSGGSGSPARIYDSAGVHIVESDVPEPDVAMRSEPTPAVRFGHVEAGGVRFANIGHVRRLANGNFAVLERNGVTRLFDSTGAFITQLTRRGEGPGEVSILLGAEVHGDTLEIPGGVGGAAFIRFSSKGEFLGVSSDNDGPPSIANLSYRAGYDQRDASGFPTQTYNWELRFKVGDSIKVVPFGATHRREMFDRFVGVATIFQNNPMMVHLRERILAIPASNPRSEVFLFDPSAMQVGLWRLRRPAQPVTAAHKAQYLESTSANARADRKADLQMLAERGIYLDSIPSFSAMEVGDAGTLWLKAYTLPWDSNQNQWFAFDSTGVAIGTVNFDPRFTPHQFSALHVTGVLLGEADVESVAMYRLRTAR